MHVKICFAPQKHLLAAAINCVVLTLEIPARFESRIRDLEFRIQDSRHRKLGTSGAVFEKFWSLTIFFFLMFQVAGGVKYIPKNSGKLLGRPPFYFQALKKIQVWKPSCKKLRAFFTWGPYLSPQDTDQKFQK